MGLSPILGFIMIRILWIVAGFFGGIIVSRNAEPMSDPETGAVFLALIAAGGVMWCAGYRGKTSAVASAVAVANAAASAQADARAQAVANSAINLYLGQQAGISPEIIGSIVDRSVIENRDTAAVFDGSHDASSVKESTS